MTWAGTKISLAKFMAGATGLEPATFGVTGREFIQEIQRLFRLSEGLIGAEIYS